METEKLYDSDPFLHRFAARVLHCEAGKNGSVVILDHTAFYPEGGGQPADHGTLGGGGEQDLNLMILPDVAVGQRLDPDEILRGHGTVEVDGHAVGAHMESYIVIAVEGVDEAADDVFSGVGLHMGEKP